MNNEPAFSSTAYRLRVVRVSHMLPHLYERILSFDFYLSFLICLFLSFLSSMQNKSIFTWKTIIKNSHSSLISCVCSDCAVLCLDRCSNQLCINTAIVYMHRFYAFHSFTQFQHNGIAMAALFLAAKVRSKSDLVRMLFVILKNECTQFDTGGRAATQIGIGDNCFAKLSTPNGPTRYTKRCLSRSSTRFSFQ